MEPIKTLLLIILIVQTIKIYAYSERDSFFRLSSNAMVPVNNQTNTSLINVISSSSGQVINKRLCLSACNRNQNCDLVAFDLDQNVCRLYRKTPFIHVTTTNESSHVIYDKFLDDLWSYCDDYSDYIHDTLTGLCYYYVSHNYTWTNAERNCVSMGLTLLMINTPGKLQLFQNVTLQKNQNIWVGSTTTIPRVFYWLDGSPINTSFWRSGEPNNALVNSTSLHEGCLVLNKNALLNDVPCSYSYQFVCQSF